MQKGYYQRHVFLCTNMREDGSIACGDHGSKALMIEMKRRLTELGMHGEGKIRVSQSKCLGRCSLGPVMVIYPEGRWYTFLDQDDMDEILHEDLLHGRPVERLLLAS